MTPENRHDTLLQVATAAPAGIAVVATKVLGLTIENWVGICGILFLVLQAAYLVWKWRRDILRERRRRPTDPDTDEAPL